jgi:metal-responsive CopG/Arc/MetJ family transcriptional regulator
MITISLKLPDELVEASTRLADRLGITRAELIRQALRHELARIQQQQELTAMAASFRAMRDSETYLAETRELDEGFAEALPNDAEDWWTASAH